MSTAFSSFKPIDDEGQSSEPLHNRQTASLIFREAVSDDSTTSSSPICRGRPLQSDGTKDSGRVISPFSHAASSEEIEERELLFRTDCSQIVDYSTFFEAHLATDVDVMDCGDDRLSLASSEDEQLCDGFIVDTDPAAFWDDACMVEDRASVVSWDRSTE